MGNTMSINRLHFAKSYSQYTSLKSSFSTYYKDSIIDTVLFFNRMIWLDSISVAFLA